MTQITDCMCSPRMYTTTLEPFTCSVCPAGAVCTDGTCSLDKPSLQCEAGMEPIIGNWKRSQDGLFALIGAPYFRATYETVILENTHCFRPLAGQAVRRGTCSTTKQATMCKPVSSVRRVDMFWIQTTRPSRGMCSSMYLPNFHVFLGIPCNSHFSDAFCISAPLT